MNPTRQWRFADFLLDVDNAQLRRDEHPVKLRPKSFEVLAYLVQHAGDLVTKDALLAAVWPGLVVSDTNLQLCLSEIRKALSDDSRHPRFVETVHRRGYRFHLHARADATAVDADVFALGTQVPFSSGSRGPVVGRLRELAHLTNLARTAESGRRQLVFVTGEPGIGKTTLVRTFLEQITENQAGDPAVPRFATGQCVIQYGAEVPYLPIFEIISSLASEPATDALDVLRRYAPSWIAQIPRLSDGSAVPPGAPGPAVSTERLLLEFAEAIEALARDRTLVLWLDDLHDSDASTLDLLAYLARRGAPARLLMVGTWRSTEIQRPDHPLRLMQQSLVERQLCVQLALHGLAEDEIESYLRGRLHGEVEFRLHDLARLIHTRTEGSPLFLVQVVGDLIEQDLLAESAGLWRLHPDHARHLSRVPSRIEDMLRGQFGVLPPLEREILDVASVIGPRFALPTLCDASGQHPLKVEAVCERLASQEHFVRRDGVEQWPDGTPAVHYRFRHAVHQEVIYAQIPPLRRQSLHQRVGESKERSHASDIGSVAVELATHFERSRDPARATTYLLAGFQQCLRRSAFREGHVLAHRGLDLIPLLGDPALGNRMELALRMAMAASYAASVGAASHDAGEQCRRALEICKQTEESVELFPVLSSLFAFYLVKAQYATAHEIGGRLLSLAQRENSSVLTLAAHVTLGMVCWHMGDMVTSRAHFEQRKVLYRPEDHLTFLQFTHDPLVTSLSLAAPVHWYLGSPDTARRIAEEGFALARQLSHGYTMGVALLFGARPFQECGDLEQVERLIEEHEATCRDQAFTEADARRQLSLGWLRAHQGRADEAVRHLSAGLEACRKMGSRMEESYHLAILGKALALNGQYDESLETLDQALRFSEDFGETYYRAEILRLRAETRLLCLDSSSWTQSSVDVLAQAVADLSQALEEARRQHARSLELRAAIGLVQLRRRFSATDPKSLHPHVPATVLDDLREAIGSFVEGHDTPDLRLARRLLEA